MLQTLRQIDFASFKTRATIGAALFGLVIGSLWILERERADRSAFREQVGQRMDAIAAGAAATIDGDALASNKTDSTEELVLELAVAHGLRRPLSVLVAADATASFEEGMILALAVTSQADEAAPSLVCSEALAEVMHGTSQSVVEESEGLVIATAPIHDAFGAVVGVVRAEASLERPVGRKLGLAAVVLLALASFTALTMTVAALAGRHCDVLAHLADGESEFAGDRWASREVRALADLLERLKTTRVSPDAANAEPEGERAEPIHAPSGALAGEHWTTVARDEPAPSAVSNTVGPATRAPLPTGTSIASMAPGAPQSARDCFDPSLLGDAAVHAYRAPAKRRTVDIRLDVGERVPPVVVGESDAAQKALECLVSNAVNHTQSATVNVRISRVIDSYHLRFEVNDAGTGVGWILQPELHERIDAAASAPTIAPSSGGLERASNLAAQMGGELGFESQPGSGSRFWFTMRYEPAPEAAMLAQRQVAS